MKNFGLIATQLTSRELSEGLKRAVHNNLDRIVEKARQEWERKFAGPDPSDSCVTVRIDESPAKKPVPVFGFVTPAKKALGQPRANLVARPAH